MFVDFGMKLELQKKTHSHMCETCKFHTEQPGIKPLIFLMKGEIINHSIHCVSSLFSLISAMVSFLKLVFY